jgi:hypothetical protein
MANEIKRSFSIPEPMNGKVRVIFTDDMVYSVSKLAPQETFLNDIAAYCDDETPGSPVIILSLDAPLMDLIHEADHAAFCILAGMGVQVTTKDNEAHAYMLEYIVSKVLKLREKIRVAA